MVDNETLSGGRNGECGDRGLVNVCWKEGSLLHRAEGDTAGLNSVEIWEGADKWPEIVRRGEESAREVKDCYLVGNWGENGYDSGSRSVNSVVEFDALEVGKGQANTGGSLENGCLDVSGVVTYGCCLIVWQDIRCISGELVKGVDLLCRVEADGTEPMVASGREQIPGCESTCAERLVVVMKMVDYLVDELWWDAG